MILPRKHTILVLYLMPLLLGCVWFTTEEIPLSYAGEIELSSFENIGNETLIHFRLSGGEWNNNSAFILRDIQSSVEGKNIYITIRGCTASGYDAPSKYHIKLNKLNLDRYTLYYRNPDDSIIKLTDIEIEHAKNAI